MVAFINKDFGTPMWVAEDRVEEYKAAGHKLAADPVPAKAEPKEEPKAEPKKTAVKKVVKKTTKKV